MGRILIVDDEPHMRRILGSTLQIDGHTTTEADGVAAATSRLNTEDFDVVFTDQKMADGEGLQVLEAAHESDPNLSVIFLTAFATIELAVDSMRRGAFDFVTKPFQPENVRAAAHRACERTALMRENNLLRETVGRLQGSPQIFGKSEGLEKVRDMIARVARTNAPVLILGETGTGKELVARSVHRNSTRATKSFIALNCASLPPRSSKASYLVTNEAHLQVRIGAAAGCSRLLTKARFSWMKLERCHRKRRPDSYVFSLRARSCESVPPSQDMWTCEFLPQLIETFSSV